MLIETLIAMIVGAGAAVAKNEFGSELRVKLMAKVARYIMGNHAKSNLSVPVEMVAEIASAAVDAAENAAVPLDILLAIMGVESAYNPFVKDNKDQDRGLMQVTPGAVDDVRRVYGFPHTHDQIKTNEPPYRIRENITAGALYLKLSIQKQVKEKRRSLDYAVMAYNGGAYRDTWLPEHRSYLAKVKARLPEIKAMLAAPD